MSPKEVFVIFTAIASVALARVPTYDDTICNAINIEGVYLDTVNNAGRPANAIYVNASDGDPFLNNCAANFYVPGFRIYDRNTGNLIGQGGRQVSYGCFDNARAVTMNDTAPTIAAGDSVSFRIEAWSHGYTNLGCVFDWCGTIATKDNGKSVASTCLTPAPTETITCGVNEVESPCYGHCRPTCDTGMDIICTQQCQPGCNCKDGYILDEYNGECIPIDECPTEPPLTYPTTTQECGVNEVFTRCNGKCRGTCATGLDIICPFVCLPGCNCKEGYILDEIDGECIPIDECPTGAPESTAEVCEENEVWDDCGTACPSVCGKDDPAFCTYQCVIGCRCKEGYILDELDGECISEAECIATTEEPGSTEDRECGDNEVWDDCGTACPGICGQDAPTICTLQCVIGCRCKEGYILDEAYGECISEAKCLGITTEEPIYGTLPSDASAYGLITGFGVIVIGLGWM